MDLELSELADVYLRYHATRRNDDFWAWEEVERQVRASLAEGCIVTQQVLIEKAYDDAALGYVAAAPLEGLIDGYGNAALDIIEAACESDQKMRLALSGIWLERGSPVLMRLRSLMKRYRFMGGSRHPLSTYPDWSL